MPLTPLDVTRKAADIAGDLLKNRASEAIKSGAVVGPIPFLGVGIARAACRRYADNPNAVSGGVAASLEDVCRPYLDNVGYGTGAGIKKPFNGGQCPGIRYTVKTSTTYTTLNCQGADPLSGTTTETTATPYGPISFVKTDVYQGCGTAGRLSSRSWQGRGFSSSGSPITWNAGGIASGTRYVSSASLNAAITRFDNAADTCGNPPPEVIDPVPPFTPGPRTTPFSPAPGTEVDISIDLNIDGRVTVNIGGGPVTIDPFGGSDDGGEPGIDQPGTAPSSGLPPGDIGSPGAPVGTSAGGSAAGSAPPNSVLVGIKIDILLAPEFSSEYDPLVRRGVCYAYMGTPGNLALEPSGVALRSGQMLFAPLDNLTSWEVRANTGYILRVTPYYRALEIVEV